MNALTSDTFGVKQDIMGKRVAPARGGPVRVAPP
jgi:hypothetical protein